MIHTDYKSALTSPTRPSMSGSSCIVLHWHVHCTGKCRECTECSELYALVTATQLHHSVVPATPVESEHERLINKLMAFCRHVCGIGRCSWDQWKASREASVSRRLTVFVKQCHGGCCNHLTISVSSRLNLLLHLVTISRDSCTVTCGTSTVVVWDAWT